mmetsp:Transcript_66855/g.178737  ORF Transcript_66855/g.178737 Transcript_66855/m.178737 type:complete len:249 (+) Transcript_66855:90-836(+)
MICENDDISSKRCVLTKKDAIEIFMLKDDSCSHAASVIIAGRYNVSPKAIRDIWTGRSWLKATEKLWNQDDLPKHNPVGRPKGKKDSRPRQLKTASVRKLLRTALEQTQKNPESNDRCSPSTVAATLTAMSSLSELLHSSLSSTRFDKQKLVSDWALEGSHHPLDICKPNDAPSHRLPSLSNFSSLEACAASGRLLPPISLLSPTSSSSSLHSDLDHLSFGAHAHGAFFPSQPTLPSVRSLLSVNMVQ